MSQSICILTNKKMRIFIKGFPFDTSADDLRQLVGRVAPAVEVYLPEPTTTGVFRDFAIVRFPVQCDESHVDKCTKSLNNSLWKGKRIVVERAKDYYRERLEREKAAEMKVLGSCDSRVISIHDEYLQNTTPKFNIDASVTSHLRLRKAKGGKYVKVSTIPNSAANNSEEILRCGNKTFFDEEGIPLTTQQTSNEHKNIVKSSKSLPQRAVGQRLGFGTLLAESEKFPEEYEEPPVPFVTHVARDSNDDEEEKITKEKLTNIYDDDPEEMLRKEKSRNLALLAAFLKNQDDAPAIKEALQVTINVENGKDQKSDAGFANLNKLTDIFQRDGGIWWGDDGSAVVKGSIDNEKQFREAERLGIDIRQKTSVEVQKSTFRLNFFDAPSEDTPTTEAINGLQIISMTGNSQHDKFEGDDLLHRGKYQNEDQEDLTKKVISFEDVLTMAKRFCRQGSLEEVIERYKLTKEKLTTDYKRKRKEAKKRGAKSIKSNLHETVDINEHRRLGDRRFTGKRFRRNIRDDGVSQRKQKRIKR